MCGVDALHELQVFQTISIVVWTPGTIKCFVLIFEGVVDTAEQSNAADETEIHVLVDQGVFRDGIELAPFSGDIDVAVALVVEGLVAQGDEEGQPDAVSFCLLG